MSPRFQRVRYRMQAGTSSGASTGGSTTALAFQTWFSSSQGFSADTDEAHWMGAPSFGGDAGIGSSNDGMKGGGDFGLDTDHFSTTGDRIESGHTKPDGSTGRIFRHIREYKSTNSTTPSGYSNGGGMDIDLTVAAIGGPHRELWFRWYQRWSTGMHPTAVDNSTGTGNWLQTKCLYWQPAYASNPNEGGWFTVGYGQGQTWGIHMIGVAGADAGDVVSSLHGWQAQQGGVKGSGQWRCYEIHVKADDGVSSNGEAHVYIDGSSTPIASRTGIDWSGGRSTWTGWKECLVGSNGAYVGSNVTDTAAMLVDYDFLALSTSGFIGSI